MEERIYPVLVALVLIIFDVATGYLAAAKNGTLNSSIMRSGLWSKLGEICSIAVGFVTEVALNVFGNDLMTVSLNVPIATGICAYIAVYELTSIVENIGCLNKDIGVWLIEHMGFDPEKVNLVYIEKEGDDE